MRDRGNRRQDMTHERQGQRIKRIIKLARNGLDQSKDTVISYHAYHHSDSSLTSTICDRT